MPVPADFTPGSPCWLDLAAADPDRSRTFYTSLFGWQTETGGEEYGNYVLFSKDGLPVAGLAPAGPGQQRDSWSTYLATEDIAATTRKVVAAGGQVLREPMQVGEQGTMAVFADPGGALVCGWQPETHLGFGLSGEAGAPCWFELLSTDYAASVAFYAQAFDWKTETMSDSEEFRYTLNRPYRDSTAGILDAAATLPAGATSHWLVYLGAPDTDDAVLRVQELGGTVMRPAWDSPFGRLAQVADPAGAVFMLISV
ncbi:VOC family protein [Arthrobacter mobilis]|uniref:VOC family protein n=1 Tax=Arthrobacter mobilis TaxID=2724944 RepID=A0A7X6K722_9MICC|nr:VOC family protein [Arthrobacter mobilis]NKX56332.1 VOC family protein [Arthrobacter mobilis]